MSDIILLEMTFDELLSREQIIDRGKKAFVEVGMALMEIRDRRGYKLAGFHTFEQYCREKWGWSRITASLHIGAAQVSKQLLSQDNNLDYTQARELARLASPSETGDGRKKEINFEAVKEVAANIDFSRSTVKTVAKAVDKKLLDIRRVNQAKAALVDNAPREAARYRLIHSGVADLVGLLGFNSIDAIITDPPYPEAFLPVYADLAKISSIILKPGAPLVVMVGHSHLPEILALMTPHIQYLWTVAYITPANTARVFSAKALINWKPVLVFSNGHYRGDWYTDVVNNSAPDKRFHDWGQGESGMAALIERFSVDGQTVLDPFCGGSATGAAALKLNRFYIGADIDENAIAISAQRMTEL